MSHRDRRTRPPPLEHADAQFLYESEGRRKPPFCRWRIEIGDAAEGARTLFLHVFELGEPGPAPELVGPAGVDIGDAWKARFNTEGAIGGTLNGEALNSARIGWPDGDPEMQEVFERLAAQLRGEDRPSGGFSGRM